MKKPRTTRQMIEEHISCLSPKTFKAVIADLKSVTCSLTCQHCSMWIWFSGNLDSEVPDTFECPTCRNVNER